MGLTRGWGRGRGHEGSGNSAAAGTKSPASGTSHALGAADFCEETLDAGRELQGVCDHPAWAGLARRLPWDCRSDGREVSAFQPQFPFIGRVKGGMLQPSA